MKAFFFLAFVQLACFSCGFKEHELSFTQPAQAGEEEKLYQLICELVQYEGKDIATVPLRKENLRHFLI